MGPSPTLVWFQKSVDALSGMVKSVRRVPMFVWLYLGVILYLYRRMTRDFLGMGTRRKRILDGRLNLDLTREEEALAAHIVDAKDLTDTFTTIGGLENAKQLLTEHVVWPMAHPELFPAGSLRTHPTGVLLFGPPGTGKTLLARALAKEISGYFLEVKVETLFTKWVGDSEKLAAAVFSLAHKLHSCVVFIDEIDSLLSQRSDNDSAVYAHAKTIFLTKWDGLVKHSEVTNSGATSSSSKGPPRIIVVGATNRPRALDEAIQRRLPVRIQVPLPDYVARHDILRILLSAELTVHEPAQGEKLISAVARRTEGYSGSDLKELCKAALMIPLREVMAARRGRTPPDSVLLRPDINLVHFEEAMRTVRPSSQL